MTWRQLPNLITLARFLLAIPVAVALLKGAYEYALLLFAIAGLSDALDGFLARRFGWFTRLGSLMDPLADKVLLVTTFSVLTIEGYLPVGFLLVVLGRDFVIVLGVCVYRCLIGQFVGQPTMLSKLCTFLQIVFGIILVLALAGGTGFELARSIQIMQWAVVISCILSGGQYVLIGLWRTRTHIREVVRNKFSPQRRHSANRI